MTPTPTCRRCHRPHISVRLPWSDGLCTTCGNRGVETEAIAQRRRHHRQQVARSRKRSPQRPAALGNVGPEVDLSTVQPGPYRDWLASRRA